MRIVFMGTPDFAVPSLLALDQPGWQVVGVVTQPDRPRGRGQKVSFSPVKEAALSRGWPVFQPLKVKDENFLAELEELRPDAIVVVAYGQILPEKILQLPPLGCINVHASLLPRYRGAAPIQWAIINGEQETGITTMYMSRELDAGDMILKAKVPIKDTDTFGTLHDRLATLGAELLVQTLTQIEQGQAPREPQDHSRATYAPMLNRETERINWGAGGQQIVNLIRGLNPWPGAYTLWEGNPLKIWQARFEPGTPLADPGTVVELRTEGPVVAAGDGHLVLTQLQPAGSRAMTGADFLRGRKLQAGTKLE
ncbi:MULTISPECIES: methionyl-tRNA formyltransferase [unclassified Carboxydocella]|uniref:methionyl-tRNA formyltransferase n=1 Tax=unclassified Carboxydocella TaxID=2685367 RepID=UPI0009AD4EC2|nr:MULTISPECIES: methionyl-tRNA formyltransferase [unclassified Carboxydocella]GAW30110.1 methionyl-tRNA formyltransferase [Carboxydocella sp. ULO1]GAW31148.1 methionyl-tRNA formyltransferase [Carboxydocella sp. JDF658]